MGIQRGAPKRGQSPLPNFGPFLLWPKGWMRQDATWYLEVGLGPDNIVLHGDPAPPLQKGDKALSISPFLLCPNGWMHQDATFYRGRPPPRRLCVRWGPDPLSQKRSPNFRLIIFICCGQMAAWIKMPPGMAVGLGTGNCVR